MGPEHVNVPVPVHVHVNGNVNENGGNLSKVTLYTTPVPGTGQDEFGIRERV